MTEIELVRLADENEKNPYDLMKEYCPCDFGYTSRCDKAESSSEYYENRHPFECTACWINASKGKSLDEELKELQQKIKPKEEPEEKVNHPGYYQQPNRRECIEEMRLMFGDERVYWWCVMTAYKYRFRAGNKADNPAEQDEKKAEWYLDYAENLKESK